MSWVFQLTPQLDTGGVSITETDFSVQDFYNLRQTSSVEFYQQQFELLGRKVIARHPHFTEEFYVFHCIKGLQEDIQSTVQMYWPSSVQEVFAIAKLKEYILAYDTLETSQTPMDTYTATVSVVQPSTIVDNVDEKIDVSVSSLQPEYPPIINSSTNMGTVEGNEFPLIVEGTSDMTNVVVDDTPGVAENGDLTSIVQEANANAPERTSLAESTCAPIHVLTDMVVSLDVQAGDPHDNVIASVDSPFSVEDCFKLALMQESLLTIAAKTKLETNVSHIAVTSTYVDESPSADFSVANSQTQCKFDDIPSVEASPVDVVVGVQHIATPGSVIISEEVEEDSANDNEKVTVAAISGDGLYHSRLIGHSGLSVNFVVQSPIDRNASEIVDVSVGVTVADKVANATIVPVTPSARAIQVMFPILKTLHTRCILGCQFGKYQIHSENLERCLESREVLYSVCMIIHESDAPVTLKKELLLLLYDKASSSVLYSSCHKHISALVECKSECSCDGLYNSPFKFKGCVNRAKNTHSFPSVAIIPKAQACHFTNPDDSFEGNKSTVEQFHSSYGAYHTLQLTYEHALARLPVLNAQSVVAIMAPIGNAHSTGNCIAMVNVPIAWQQYDVEAIIEVRLQQAHQVALAKGIVGSHSEFPTTVIVRGVLDASAILGCTISDSTKDNGNVSTIQVSLMQFYTMSQMLPLLQDILLQLQESIQMLCDIVTDIALFESIFVVIPRAILDADYFSHILCLNAVEKTAHSLAPLLRTYHDSFLPDFVACLHIGSNFVSEITVQAVLFHTRRSSNCVVVYTAISIWNAAKWLQGYKFATLNATRLSIVYIPTHAFSLWGLAAWGCQFWFITVPEFCIGAFKQVSENVSMLLTVAGAGAYSANLLVLGTFGGFALVCSLLTFHHNIQEKLSGANASANALMNVLVQPAFSVYAKGVNAFSIAAMPTGLHLIQMSTLRSMANILCIIFSDNNGKTTTGLIGQLEYFFDGVNENLHFCYQLLDPSKTSFFPPQGGVMYASIKAPDIFRIASGCIFSSGSSMCNVATTLLQSVYGTFQPFEGISVWTCQRSWTAVGDIVQGVVAPLFLYRNVLLRMQPFSMQLFAGQQFYIFQFYSVA